MLENRIPRSRGLYLAAIMAVTGAALASIIVLRGPAGQGWTSVDAQTEASASVSAAEAPALAVSVAPSARMQEALEWVNGLATRQILPTDVTSRLQLQDPRLARTVLRAWSSLYSFDSPGS